MKALFICENLMKAIKRKEIVKGRVHSVFDNACNIETDHEFITLLSPEKEMAPMCVIAGNGSQVNFKKLNLIKDLIFNFSVSSICCSEENIFISLDGVQMWFPGVLAEFSNCMEEEVLENIKTMETGLIKYGKLYGIGPLAGILKDELPELELSGLKACSPDKNLEFIRHRFLSFIKAAANGDAGRITQAAENIIGFGPGLTPAVDDFISGIMISFIYSGHYYKLDVPRIREFNRELISKGLGKTTRVSWEMLRHSAAGEANQAVRELIQAIFNRHNAESVTKALIKTVGLGETSGSDTALGIYVGCKIMTNLKYRGEWTNESMCGCKKGQLL